MNNKIMEFLETYQQLDELCRQILSSDRGISEYIDEMDYESQGYRIAGWENDYKRLKKMRWIRNRLVHEVNSFDDNLANAEDIEWLNTFYCRIMECTDPFSLLHQAENRNSIKRKQEMRPEIPFSTDTKTTDRNVDLHNKEMILARLILAVIILIIILCFIFCLVMQQ